MESRVGAIARDDCGLFRMRSSLIRSDLFTRDSRLVSALRAIFFLRESAHDGPRL